MSDLDALTTEQMTLIIRNYQTMVELILIQNQELGYDIAATRLNRTQLKLIAQWQADCTKAVELAGEAISAGITISAALKARGTH